jgi:hypothetical protein
MTDSEHARLVGELNDSLRRLAAWTEWLKRLQLGAAVLLVAYQLCMGIATVIWPTRVFSPNEWRELSSWISIRFGGTHSSSSPSSVPCRSPGGPVAPSTL